MCNCHCDSSNVHKRLDVLTDDRARLVWRVETLEHDAAELRVRIGLAELAPGADAIRANALQRELDDARAALRRYRERRISP
jgi:hypothetical protein